MICPPPTQSPTELLAQYFHNYRDFLNLRAHLENSSNNLNDPKDWDKFINGCTHSQALINIACEDRRSSDPTVQQQFKQCSIINTLYSYLCDLNLVDGPVPKSSSSQYHAHDSDDNYADNKIP